VTEVGRAARLGLKENLPQFTLLVGVNALVGGMVGQERTVVPLLAERVFGLETIAAALTFIVAFGLVKAVTNLVAGSLSDRIGRKPVLVAGWLAGLPVPFLLMWAPTWAWIVAANVLLGVNQGLTWSTTVIMKVDLVGPRNRGLAMGLNEAAGYGAVALAAMATGFIASRTGLRPEPFFVGVACAGLGLGISTLWVRETREHATREQEEIGTRFEGSAPMSARNVFALTTYRERALSACSQAGLVNNLNDGVAWGLFPIYFAREGLSIAAVGVLMGIYPAVWSIGQIATGALSDRVGRKWLIAGGMGVQAAGIGLVAGTSGFGPWALGSVLLGLGTAMVYPTLLAAVSDVADPSWRASAIGTYRFWRDAGFALGAIAAGLLADAFGRRTAIGAVATLTALSGIVVAVRMYETHPALIRPASRRRPPAG
jgi:MFS family permease